MSVGVGFSTLATDLFFSVAAFLQSPKEISPYITKYRMHSDIKTLAKVSKDCKKKCDAFYDMMSKLTVSNLFSETVGKNLFLGVRIVDLTGVKLPERWIEQIRERTPNVATLVLPQLHFQEDVAKELATLERLTSLNLFLCTKVDPKSFEHLPSIRKLSFTVSPFFLAFIEDPPDEIPWELTKVGQEIEVAGEKVTDAYLQELVPYVPNLESFRAETRDISKVGLQALGALKDLQSLSLEPTTTVVCRLQTQDVQHLQPVTRLTSLSIHINNESDPTVIQKLFEAVPHLKKLSLSSHVFPDLSGIENFQNLEELSISAPFEVKRVSIEPICKLVKLQRLFISVHAVDVASLQGLSALKNLKSLNLQVGNARIKDFPTLKTELPHCTVRVNDHDRS